MHLPCLLGHCGQIPLSAQWGKIRLFWFRTRFWPVRVPCGSLFKHVEKALTRTFPFGFRRVDKFQILLRLGNPH